MTTRRVITLASAREDLRRIGRFNVADLIGDIDALLAKEAVGTADAIRHFTHIDLAAAIILARIPLSAPGTSGDASRGGSSSPIEEEDRSEAGRLTRQAIADNDALPQTVRALKNATTAALAIPALLDELIRLWKRNTAVIDHSKLPREIPGCASCGRSGNFSPIVEHKIAAKVRGTAAADRALEQRLCRWCWDHSVAHAEADGRDATEIGERDRPPKEACDIMHRQSPRAAGRWLAERERRAS